MIRFRKAARTPIGVDFGTRCVKAAQLSRAPGGGWRVEAAALLPRARPGRHIEPAEVRRLCDVLRRQGFVGREIVLAAPPHLLLTAVQDLPPRATGVPLEQIARVELARAYKRDPQALEMAMWELPPSPRDEGTQVMAVGCETRDADHLLDLFEGQGLAVRALDAHACAVTRASCANLRCTAGISAAMDLGWESALLLVLHKGVVIYQRSLPEAAMQPLQRTLMQRLRVEAETADFIVGEVGLTAERRGQNREDETLDKGRGAIVAHFDALAGELAASLSYAAHQYPDAAMERLGLIGGGAATPGLTEHLRAALKADVMTVSPADVAECAPTLEEACRSPAMTAAVGLALHGEGAGDA